MAGATHPNGAITAANSRIPSSCVVISTVWSVSRSIRVVIISQCVDDAAAERDQRRQGDARGRRPQRDHDAAEPDQHRGPAPPADALAEQQHRQRRHIDRAGQIECRGVGERHVADRPEEHRDLERRQHDAQELQTGPRRIREHVPAGAPDQGEQQDQRHRAADQQELADRIFRDQPFARRAVEREQEHRRQHEAGCRRARPNASRWGKSSFRSRRGRGN